MVDGNSFAIGKESSVSHNGTEPNKETKKIKKRSKKKMNDSKKGKDKDKMELKNGKKRSFFCCISSKDEDLATKEDFEDSKKKRLTKDPEDMSNIVGLTILSNSISLSNSMLL